MLSCQTYITYKNKQNCYAPQSKQNVFELKIKHKITVIHSFSKKP